MRTPEQADKTLLYHYVHYVQNAIAEQAKILDFEDWQEKYANVIAEQFQYVAKLVTASFTTRVIVKYDAGENEILEAARPGIADKVRTELYDNVQEIEDDINSPYDSEYDKVN